MVVKYMKLINLGAFNSMALMIQNTVVHLDVSKHEGEVMSYMHHYTLP